MYRKNYAAAVSVYHIHASDEALLGISTQKGPCSGLSAQCQHYKMFFMVMSFSIRYWRIVFPTPGLPGGNNLFTLAAL